MFSWSVHRNPNRSSDKSTQIPIGTLINQSESQSKHGQSISRTITTWPVREVNEHKVDGIT